MTPQEQADERAEQVKQAEEQTRRAMEELQRHGEAGNAVAQLGMGRG
ncbi:hypothetical protein ACGFMO_37175 [Streptomyces niveus]